MIPGIRGKLLLGNSIAVGTFTNGRSICELDNYSFDGSLNRIVKASVKSLVSDPSLTADIAVALKNHLARLEMVQDVRLSMNLFDRLVLNTHNNHYRLVVELCKLVAENLVLSNETREAHLQSFLEKDVKMHRIFESFIRKFFDRNLGAEYRVTAEKYHWEVGDSDSMFRQRIPELQTDVTVLGPKEVLVIDAKYYSEALTSNRGTFKYRRDHLSQIMEYIRAAKKRHNSEVRGMLLYPTVGETIDDRGVLEGMNVSVCTIDLSKSWIEIKNSLLSLANSKVSE